MFYFGNSGLFYPYVINSKDYFNSSYSLVVDICEGSTEVSCSFIGSSFN